MKHVLSLFALSLIATGLIGLLTLALTTAAPTLEIRVLAVIGAVLGGIGGDAVAHTHERMRERLAKDRSLSRQIEKLQKQLSQ